MRNVIYKIAACSALVALVLSGCKESFLEEDPNGYISSDQIKENAVWQYQWIFVRNRRDSSYRLSARQMLWNTYLMPDLT